MQQILENIHATTFCPPDIIILYGPPASGKGTQAHNLCTHLMTYQYQHLDFGHMLREYVSHYLGEFNTITENNIRSHEQSQDTHILRAITLYRAMKEGKAVPPDDIWFIVEKKVRDILQKGERIVIDGLGRTIDDCYRFSAIIKEYNATVALFHICLTEDQIIQRSVNRWYIPHGKLSYPSYKIAKLHVTHPDDEPWQRPEDANVTKIRDRYRNIYERVYAKALSTLQTECCAQLFIIDGGDTIDETFTRIIFYLNTYFHTVSTHSAS